MTCKYKNAIYNNYTFIANKTSKKLFNKLKNNKYCTD